MKKLSLFVVILLITQLLNAKDYKLVVRPTDKINKGHTEVKFNNDVNGEEETITIKPSSDITTITISVRDVNGMVLSQDAVPASDDGTYVLTIPEFSNGTVLEIKDNTGIVYLYN